MKRHQSPTRVLLFVGFLGAVVFGVMSFSFFASLTPNDAPSFNTGSTVSVMLSPTATAWYDDPRIPPADREVYKRLPPEKQIYFQRDWEARLHALDSTPIPGATKPPIPTIDSKATPYSLIPHTPAGAGAIIEGGPPSFCSTCFVEVNVWYETVNGKTTVIFAGALPDNPGAASQPASQGMVFVWGEGGYPTPSKAGAVRIIGAQGERLILQAIDGTATFYFDYPARQYVSSLTDVAPTVTPTLISPPSAPVPTIIPTRRPYP